MIATLLLAPLHYAKTHQPPLLENAGVLSGGTDQAVLKTGASSQGGTPTLGKTLVGDCRIWAFVIVFLSSDVGGLCLLPQVQNG